VDLSRQPRGFPRAKNHALSACSSGLCAEALTQTFKCSKRMCHVGSGDGPWSSPAGLDGRRMAGARLTRAREGAEVSAGARGQLRGAGAAEPMSSCASAVPCEEPRSLSAESLRAVRRMGCATQASRQAVRRAGACPA
jgi:hypothetical protein